MTSLNDEPDVKHVPSDALTQLASAVMLDSGRGKRRLKGQGDVGSLKVFFKGTRILGVSQCLLATIGLRKRFQRFRQGARTQE